MGFYDIKVLTRKGEEVEMSSFKGKVLLIVNTATGCGFTPQYKGLEELYQKYNSQGLEILDFPCNQFGNQAPESDEEIHEFCTFKYKTSFDQFKKIDVNGEDETELYKYLKAQMTEEKVEGVKGKMAMKAIEKISSTCKNEGDIKWNFTKFLVDRDGNVVGRFAPTTEPSKIEEYIKELL